MYEIRKIRSDEVEEALAWEVFLEFEAPDYRPEGTETFRRDIVENEQFITMCRQGVVPIYAAFIHEESGEERQDGRDGQCAMQQADQTRGRMAGIIGMRSETHINLVFTRKEYHRKGIATAIFRYLLADIRQKNPAIQAVTLNASPYGKPFYIHLGFESLAEEQEKHGIRYTPMKYVIRETE